MSGVLYIRVGCGGAEPCLAPRGTGRNGGGRLRRFGEVVGRVAVGGWLALFHAGWCVGYLSFCKVHIVWLAMAELG